MRKLHFPPALLRWEYTNTNINTHTAIRHLASEPAKLPKTNARKVHQQTGNHARTLQHLRKCCARESLNVCHRSIPSPTPSHMRCVGRRLFAQFYGRPKLALCFLVMCVFPSFFSDGSSCTGSARCWCEVCLMGQFSFSIARTYVIFENLSLCPSPGGGERSFVRLRTWKAGIQELGSEGVMRSRFGMFVHNGVNCSSGPGRLRAETLTLMWAGGGRGTWFR